MFLLLRAIFFLALFSTANLQAVAVTPSLTEISPIKDPNALIGNELARLDALMRATRKSLEGQTQLKEKISQYQKIQDAYLLHPDDNEILFRMIKIAHQTLTLIRENHLEHIFDPDFINELTIIAKVATKRGIPKP